MRQSIKKWMKGRPPPRVWRDERGAAALELAIWAGILAVPVLSVVDLGFYIFQRMELENATQVAAQAVWKHCDLTQLPATTRCPSLSTTINTAIQSTSLSTGVTATATNEGYYCMVGSTLTPTGGSLSSGTTTCANGSTSADYIRITGSYSYRPVFSGLSLASLLTTPITKTVWMRLN